jgi:GTP cyclohydrolase IA
MNNSHVEDLIIKKEKLTNGNSKENGTNTKVVQIAKLVKEMLEILNPNADNEIMSKTPFRYAEAMLELTQGQQENALETISDAIFDSEGYDDMIIVKDINFNSICEHHLLPFFGDCTIGYIPNGKILGLSKFPRLVRSLSKKMHIQERLTKEIAEHVNKALDPSGVVVLLTSTHSCMCFRGVKSFNSKTDTIYTIGALKQKENLDKFFSMLRK